MIKFILVVNRQGNKRVSRYYEHVGHPDDRLTTELDIVRRTLSHDHKQVNSESDLLYTVVCWSHNWLHNIIIDNIITGIDNIIIDNIIDNMQFNMVFIVSGP